MQLLVASTLITQCICLFVFYFASDRILALSSIVLDFVFDYDQNAFVIIHCM